MAMKCDDYEDGSEIAVDDDDDEASGMRMVV